MIDMKLQSDYLTKLGEHFSQKKAPEKALPQYC